MPLVTYQDLCIDASDAPGLGRFWSRLLGWDFRALEDGDAQLRDGDRVHVWVNQVPEPVIVKNRLHLDVNATSLDPALMGGAAVVDDSQDWTVLKDPDGQEFCVFLRDAPVKRHFYELVWDVTGTAADARRVAEWWGEAFGVDAGHDEDSSWLEGVPGTPFQYVVFAPVPEPKTTKNRVHIDVTTDDVAALLARGATLLRPKGDGGIAWHVLADPEGNEFCAFTPD